MLLLLLLLPAVQVRMLCSGAAVTLMLITATVQHVGVAPLGTVETVVPLTVNVDETGAVLRAERY